MAEHFGSLALPVGEFLALEHGTGTPLLPLLLPLLHRAPLPPPLLEPLLLSLQICCMLCHWSCSCNSGSYTSLALVCLPPLTMCPPACLPPAEYAGYAIPSTGSSPGSNAADELKRIEVGV